MKYLFKTEIICNQRRENRVFWMATAARSQYALVCFMALWSTEGALAVAKWTLARHSEACHLVLLFLFGLL